MPIFRCRLRGVTFLPARSRGSMTLSIRATAACALFASICLGCHNSTDSSPHRAGFVRVRDGTRLHYIDWGGTGPTLVLLAGLGGTAHTFDDLAPKLTNNFHVVGITRRGTGESDRPDSAYDVLSRTQDDLDVLDSLKIGRAFFVGHSIAGDELSELGAHHPDRVAGLVYLDAAYVRADEPKDKASDPARGVIPAPRVITFDELVAKRRSSPVGTPPAMLNDLRLTQRGSDGDLVASPPIPIYFAMMRGTKSWRPDYRAIKAPVIAIFAFSPVHPMVDLALEPKDSVQAREWNAWWQQTHWAWQDSVIASLKRDIPSARIIALKPADHVVYFSNERDVVAAINSLPKR